MQSRLSLLSQSLVLQRESCPGSRVPQATPAFLAAFMARFSFLDPIQWIQEFVIVVYKNCQNVS